MTVTNVSTLVRSPTSALNAVSVLAVAPTSTGTNAPMPAVALTSALIAGVVLVAPSILTGTNVPTPANDPTSAPYAGRVLVMGRHWSNTNAFIWVMVLSVAKSAVKPSAPAPNMPGIGVASMAAVRNRTVAVIAGRVFPGALIGNDINVSILANDPTNAGTVANVSAGPPISTGINVPTLEGSPTFVPIAGRASTAPYTSISTNGLMPVPGTPVLIAARRLLMVRHWLSTDGHMPVRSLSLARSVDGVSASVPIFTVISVATARKSRQRSRRMSLRPVNRGTGRGGTEG